MIVVARYLKGCKMLERYEGKLSRTVLRRGEASNRLFLVYVKITNTYEYHKLHEYTTTKAVNSAEKFGLYCMSKTYALVCGQHRFSVCR